MINRRGQMYSVTPCSIYLRYICLTTSLTEHCHRVCLSSQSPDKPRKCHFPWFTDKKPRYTGWDPLIISAVKSLHHPTVPTRFPPYHKGPHAAVIPSRGTLGRQSVCSQHGQWRAVAPRAAQLWHGAKSSRPSLNHGLPHTEEVKMIPCWLCDSGAW